MDTVLHHTRQHPHTQHNPVPLPVYWVISLIISCCAVCSLASCTSSAHITVRNNTDYSLTADFEAGSLLEKNITHLLKQKGGQAQGDSIFNRQELQDSLTQAGLTVTGITLKGAMGLRIAGTIPYNHKLLAHFISYDRSAPRTTLRISPENITSFLSALPQDSRDFIDMLMAPLFTGEALTTIEYEELIGAAYGKKLAAELKNAAFVLTVDVPYAIQTAGITPIGAVTIQKKTTAASSAVIRIPLLDLLCTVTPIEVQL